LRNDAVAVLLAAPGIDVTRRGVTVLILAWLAVHWTAVAYEFDHFPLTDAGMYANWKKKEILSYRVRDTESYKQGFTVTRRDGTTDAVRMEELNIPRRHMYQLYFQKIHRRPAPLLLRSFNKTLGHKPDDPAFIVRITVPYVVMSRRASDIRNVWTESHVTTLEWDEAWRESW